METTKRQGIATFLEKRVADSPFLIPRWSVELETQVNVHEGSHEADPDDGAVSEDDSKVWSDDTGQRWMNFRWPYKAMSTPYYKDTPLEFSPGAHATRIGSTWWNWVKKKSVAISFDIDVEGAGHAATTNMVTEERLKELLKLLEGAGYVTCVRSTGGKGAHGYVFFNPADQPNSANHTEHTGVAIATIAKLCKDTDFDWIGQKIIDVKGVVTWFWADSSPKGHPGFELLFEQRYQIGASDLTDYMSVKMPSTNKPITVEGFTDTGAKVVETVDGEFEIHPLEEAHKEILRELEDMGWSFTWIDEYNQARTHTAALKALHDKRAAENRPLKGLFNTITSNSGGKTKPNCYIAPRPGGGFRVARFGNTTNEHGLWEVYEDKSWTFFNQETNVLGVMRRYAASYDGPKLTFTAKRLQDCMECLEQTLPDGHEEINAPVTVHLQKDGRFVATLPAEAGAIAGWKKTAKGARLELPVIHCEVVYKANLMEEADKIARMVITPQAEFYGWAMKTKTNGWIIHKAYTEVSPTVSKRFGKDAMEVRADMSQSPWTMVHLPFEKEYPGGRDWNKDAPQFAFEPSPVAGAHPHFDMILEHLGATLDAVVQGTEWCQKWGMVSGADYLRFWIAALIKEPMQPLPYLFFFGPQNSGKSIFFETLDLLFTCGVVSASSALSSSFNAELAHCIVGYIDEKDLSGVKDGIYAKIKEMITARQIEIHKKGHTPYRQPNTIHLVQCSNSAEYLRIDSGDTKITGIEVNPIRHLIPKAKMEAALKAEAPFFLRTLLLTILPDPIDRLRVPILASTAKLELERMNMTPIEAFAADTLMRCAGQTVSFKDFYEAYVQDCEKNDREPESLISVTRKIRVRSDVYMVGRGKGNATYIANMTMDKNATMGNPLALNPNGRIVLASEV